MRYITKILKRGKNFVEENPLIKSEGWDKGVHYLSPSESVGKCSPEGGGGSAEV